MQMRAGGESREDADDGALPIAGSHHSPRRSQLLTSAIIVDEDDESEPAGAQRPPEQAKQQRSPHVSDLDTFNVDRFFLDKARAVKVVLFTRKPNTPSLWSQVAEAKREIASFGVVRHTEDQLLERFSLSEEMLPKVIAFVPTRRTTFEGTVDFENLSRFVANAASSAPSPQAAREEEEEWLSMDFGAQSADPDDALRPRFSFRRQDGVQIMSGGNLTPVMRGFVWARREQVLSRLESGRLYDIAQALLLQHVQNERSPFKHIVSPPVLALSDALTAEIGAGGESERPGLKEAEALLRDGRLAYPREDGAEIQALIEWNLSSLSHLRASAQLAAPSAALLQAFDKATASLQSIATSLPLPAAAQTVMEEVQRELAAGGEGGSLSTVQGARLKEMVQAALLLYVIGDANLRHEFGGGLAAARTEEGERAAHLLRYCKLLAGEALASTSSFGAAGSKAALIVCDPKGAEGGDVVGEPAEASNARLMLEHADPPFDLALRSTLSLFHGDNVDAGGQSTLWGGAGMTHNVQPVQVGAAREYQCAVFNCYMIRRVQMNAESSRHAELNSALSSLLSVLRHMAALALPAAFTPPSPFAPLVYSEAR